MTRPQPQPAAAARATAVAADIPTRDILGIPVAMTDYLGAVNAIDAMVDRRERGYVCAVAVHSLTVALDDPDMSEALRGASLVLPDGMPVVWAANMLGANLKERVYGPELMLRFSERCAERGHRVWLYGGRDQGSLAQLALNLRRRLPGINIVGGYSPPFRPMTAEEEDALVDQINAAKPDMLWVGIGVPKQEKWMARMRERLDVPVMCAVGAAFDFHAGRISQAPTWMQQRGLEWIYRLAQEPRRLLPRYLYSNPRFLLAFARQYIAGRGARA
jgi:N-acetylglucosaminyldiphosphoundecaprenol N-acetyl-beta-D-mannosaminyltransferase